MAPLRFIESTILAAIISAGAQCACADIYTWVDASGTTNVSNIAPPEGTHVTGVIKASAVKPADPDALRDAEVRALAERVRQLQDEVEFARHPPPAPVAYPFSAPPPPMQYAAAAMPPAVQYYETGSPPVQGTMCDPAFQFCGLGWGFGGVPAVVVVAAPYGRHFHGVRGPPRGFAPRPGRTTGRGRWH